MKKLFSFILALMAIATVCNTASAQLSGTKTIPGDYATISAAVLDLNTQGVGPGGVIFNVSAGYTESITTAINMTATGTSTSPITFQKFGSGANPVINAQPGAFTPSSATPDGPWVFQGSDYVTIDGIDINDPNTTNPQTMEYGYGLFKKSVTDGCQYITIKNCVITLNRINNASGSAPMVDGSVGILVTNSLFNAATTALVPTSSTGSNSYNKFYSNTIQNCNYGVVIYGYADVTPFTLADFGNDIGGTSAGQGNQILNYGGGAATNPAAGIRTLNQQGLNISYNTINNNNGSGVNHATTLRGIYAQSGTSANITITYNTLTIKSAVTTSQVSVIENGTGTTAAGNTVNISYNTITNCANDLATTSAWYGVYNNGATAANLIMSNNTFTGNTTKATSGAVYMVYNNAAVPTSINMSNNNLSHAFTNTAAYTGTIYSVYNSSGTIATNLTMSNNNFSNYSFGSYTNSGTIYFLYNTNSSANLTFSGNTWTNLNLYHTGSEYLIYNNSSTQVALTVTNNSIVTGYTRTSTTGSMYCYYSGSSSLGTSTQLFSGNNFSNINSNVNGTGTFYGLYSTDGASSPYPKKTVFNNTLSNIVYKGTTLYGIYMSYLGDGSTTSGSSMYNNTVTNITDSASTYSFYAGSTTSPTYAPTVYGNNVNNVNSLGASYIVYGYYLGASTPGLNFYKNKAYNITASGATGLAYGLYTLSAYPYNIYNNYIGDIKAPASSPASTPYLAAAGIYLSSGTTVNVMYNTVYLNTTSTGTNFSTAAIYGSTGVTSINLQNNIFTNLSTPKGAGFTIAYQRSGTAWTNYAATSNSNDFYAGTPGTSNLICYDGTNSYQTLTSYKGIVSPRDNNSFTENPNYLSTTGSDANYLHINPAIATQIESGGVTISTPNITDDFDANPRYPNSGYPNNPSSPAYGTDVGADEFAGIWVDILPPTITYTPLLNTPGTAARNITATITDPSGVPKTGLGLPVLYWRINSGSYTPSTSVYSGSNQYTFVFGSGVTLGDTVYYYVAAQDSASTPNVGVNPSAGASGFTSNPPACTTPPAAPNKYVISQSALSGDYTVGVSTFNKVTGKNITFEKSVKRTLKQVFVEDKSENNVQKKGEEFRKSDESTGDKPKGHYELREVEDIVWTPIENGKPYTGELYIKKSESPGYTYPNNVNGIYASITAAVADLNLRGVGGPTRFLLTDTLYSTETFPLVVNIANINTTTATNTVTIKPNTGVTARIAGAAAGTQIFRILNNYVTIDGSNINGGTTKNLTIQNSSTTTPSVLYLASVGTTPLTNVTVKNTTIINGVNTSSALILRDSSGTAGYFNNITIQNNSVQLAYIGLYCNAVQTGTNGNGLLITDNDISSSTNQISSVGIYVQGAYGATVSNNTIGNFNTTTTNYRYGIWFATGTNNSTISGNDVGNLNTSTSYYPYGIALTPAITNANVIVTGNTIHDFTSTSTGDAVTGIYLGGATSGVKIQKNKIYHMYNTNSGGYGAWGIALSSSLTASNTEVSNNLIYDINAYGYGSTLYENGIGIFMNTGGGYNVYYNSVNLYVNQTLSTGLSMCLYATSSVSTASSLDIRNNIFTNYETVGANYCVYFGSANTIFTDINYNDYYASDAVTGKVGYIGALARTTLADWRTGSGKDLNSVSGDPKYTSNTDLHINTYSASPVSNAGTYVAAVLTDYDGNTRSVTTPDIGADEYTAAVPALISPANNSVGNNLSLNLIWTKPGASVNFNVIVATDTGFTSVILNDTTLTDSTAALTGLSPLTYYYWKVRAKNAAGNWAPFSSVYNFKTFGSPNTVVLASPTNGAVNQPVNLSFNWYKATEQTLKKTSDKNGKSSPLAVSNYWFELATDSSFGSIVAIDSSITDTTKSVAGLSNNTKYYWRVKANNASGWGTFSSVWNFTTIAPVPGVPTLISPAFNSTGNPLSLSFVWSKPANSINYNIVIATDAGFASVILNDSTLTDTTKAVTNLSPLTYYYWKVRAKSASGWSAFSSAFVFRTVGSASQVTLNSPSNNAVNQPLSITFNWFKAYDLTNIKGRNPGVKGQPLAVSNYWFELAGDAGFTTIISRDSSLTDTSKSVSGLSNNTTYYWRVKAKNQIGWGSFSSAFNFTTMPPAPNAPSLISPANNSTGNPLNLNLIWSKPQYAAGYNVVLSTDAGFSTIIQNDSTLTDSLKALTNLSPLTTYYWKVRAKNAAGWSSFSTVYNFKTVGSASQVTLNTPVNNAVNQPLSIAFKWYKAFDLTDAIGNKGDDEKSEPLAVSNYWFELSTDSTFATVVTRDSTLTDSTKTVSGLSNITSYFWRVKAKNQIGWGSFSAVWKFTTIVPVPAAPVLVTPANGSTGVSMTPTLTWNAVTYAATYRVQVSTDSLFATTQWDTTGVGTTSASVPSGKLAQNTKYYWRVNATNINGTGSWSTVWNFRTLALNLTLNLKVYLEGFWDGSTHVSDTVSVYLAGATAPHTFVDSMKVVLSATGTAPMNFSRVSTGSYYIVVQHRNHLQTWSATAQSFVAGTPLSYDFTTAATQAFGSNMKQVGTAWVLYGGDPNIDGSIDAIDIGLFITQFGNQGYLSCDFNGDGDVNASDVQIIAANFGLTVAIPSVPPPGPDNSWRKKVNVNELQNMLKNNGKEKDHKNNKNNN